MSYDYPKLYYRIYPKIINAVESMDDLSKLTKKQIENSIGRIYLDMVGEFPEIHEDIYERKHNARRNNQLIYYGRSKVMMDLIAILLMSELLRINNNI